MIIIDEKNGVTYNKILIMLTPNEASEMASKIESINAEIGDHIHINDIDYKKEITIAIYTEKNLHFYKEKIRKLILG